MSIAFLYHLCISSIIFYIIATWFKFFLRLRLSVDFSYIAIVLFGSYTSSILNIHYGRSIILTMIVSLILTIPFSFIIIYLSKRLSWIYFVIGTLSIYMFFFQLAANRQYLTWWPFGLSGIKRVLIWDIKIVSLEEFFILSCICCIIIMIGLSRFKKTYFFSILKGRWENHIILKSLGIHISYYTFMLIFITSICAVVGGNLFAFYYMYIDPQSFWLSMLILLLTIAFISYQQWEFLTLITSIIVILSYEYLRFFKIVDPALLGYFREIIFSVIIMIASYITFKNSNFGREQ
jgi:branched-chain amino acid transport system permease protein